jgi:geranylgeranyl pyrophosphate synthase
VPFATALAAALSLEWLHTASLVQDDLPCMDDDPVRRRTPSAHVRHGEGLALLASDALVALAFEDVAALARDPAVGAERAATLLAALARELGAGGTVGGQALDLLARERGVTDLRTLLEIHRHKTAPLFRLAATVGAVLADLPPARRAALEATLASLGVAFQIVDDLLDAAPRPGNGLGRPLGSDARARRATFATAVRHERARDLARTLAVPFATLGGAEPLRTAFARLAEFVVVRSG